MPLAGPVPFGCLLAPFLLPSGAVLPERDAWFQAPDQAIAREIQVVAMREAVFVPLGQYRNPAA